MSPTMGPSPHEDRPDVQIALIGATSGGSSLSALHAMQGARLALDLANEEGGLPVDVLAVASDTEEDSTRVDEIVDELSGDPRYVAAVIWPSTEEAAELGDRLSTAGIPFIDLSPAVPGLGRRGWDGWRRLVGTDAAQAEAAARYIKLELHARHVCVVTDTEPRGAALRRMVSRDLRALGVAVVLQAGVQPQLSDYASLVARVEGSECDALFWGGGGTEAGVVRTQMVEAGLGDVSLVGTDMVRTEAFLESAGPAGEGSVASCPCMDVTSRTDLAVQRFIQEYQARYGSAPTSFAVEGWDAAQHIIASISGGDADRASILESLKESPPRFIFGLGRPYAFKANGELARPVVSLFEDKRGDWLLLTDPVFGYEFASDAKR